MKERRKKKLLADKGLLPLTSTTGTSSINDNDKNHAPTTSHNSNNKRSRSELMIEAHEDQNDVKESAKSVLHPPSSDVSPRISSTPTTSSNTSAYASTSTSTANPTTTVVQNHHRKAKFGCRNTQADVDETAPRGKTRSRNSVDIAQKRAPGASLGSIPQRGTIAESSPVCLLSTAAE